MPAKKKSLLDTLPKRHRLFLNPYTDARFSSCPQCGKKTKLRKKPFVIHIDPNQLMVLNMSGPFCPGCDLVILHQDKIEALLAASFEQRRPEIIGNRYVVVGTVDRQTWLESQKKPTDPSTTISQTYLFLEQVKFEPARWQWLPDDTSKDKDK